MKSSKALPLSQEWIQAAIALDVDPSQAVLCPNCSEGFLEVLDFEGPGSSGGVYAERVLRCPVCSASNAVLRKVPKTES